MSQTQQRAQALHILDIKNEDQLAKIHAAVVDKSQGVEELLEVIPKGLIALARHLEKPDFQAFITQHLPVSNELAETAKTIYDREIGSLTSHPAFGIIEKVLRRMLGKKEASDLPPSSQRADLSPFLSIQSVTHAPLLLGKKPPFLPLLNFEVISSDLKTAWSAQVHWFDLLFLAKSLAEGVVDHAEGVEEMIRNGQITPAPEGFGETLEELDQAVSSLRRLLVFGKQQQAQE